MKVCRCSREYRLFKLIKYPNLVVWFVDVGPDQRWHADGDSSAVCTDGILRWLLVCYHVQILQRQEMEA